MYSRQYFSTRIRSSGRSHRPTSLPLRSKPEISGMLPKKLMYFAYYQSLYLRKVLWLQNLVLKDWQYYCLGEIKNTYMELQQLCELCYSPTVGSPRGTEPLPSWLTRFQKTLNVLLTYRASLPSVLVKARYFRS